MAPVPDMVSVLSAKDQVAFAPQVPLVWATRLVLSKIITLNV